MTFFEQTGRIAIGSRLRMLAETLTTDAVQLYRMYGVELQPKWFPVFYVLSQGEPKTITAIAREIGHSHPSVSKIIAEMSRKGLIAGTKDGADARRNVVALSEKGKSVNDAIQYQYRDVKSAVDEISQQTRHDLWEAIGEWEFLLEQKSLFRRVQEKKKERESREVQIVDYSPEYKQAFRDLNEEWITKYFKMEAADYKALDHPDTYIIDKGGFIFVALYHDEPVGVCALIRMNDPDYDYELAKMAVSPKMQGKNVGWMLGKAVVEKARSLGASSVYIESNTLLKPAINLYHKLGFQKVAGRATPYERCNIQMELRL